MNVTGKTKIFRKEFEDGGIAYSRSISSRGYENGQQTDEWISAYENVKLPKDTVLTNGSTIDVKRGFEAVYKNKKGEVVRQLIIQDYELLEAGAPSGFRKVDDTLDDCPF